MKKQKMTDSIIAANTDENGIINWDNIEIPQLVKPGEKAVMTFIWPDGTRTHEVITGKASTKK